MLIRFTVAAASAAALVIAVPDAGARVRVTPAQELVRLYIPHKAYSKPTTRAAIVRRVSVQRPITGGLTVLPVVGRTTKRGVRWLLVLLPGRPNGGKGWIAARGTQPGVTLWSIVVKRSRRRVLVYRNGRHVRSLAAIVGKRSTPTPRGRFFVEENVRMPAGSAGAPYALALSARSNVLQEFEGGPGQIGIHGVRNVGGRLGTAVSHGCVRLSNRSVTWLAARIPPGAIVTIV